LAENRYRIARDGLHPGINDDACRRHWLLGAVVKMALNDSVSKNIQLRRVQIEFHTPKQDNCRANWSVDGICREPDRRKKP
jgi:hypothetical protein